MKSLIPVLAPSRWTVRTRSAVASTVVVAVCLMLAGGALLMVLYRSLETSSRATATARVAQITEQLQSDAPNDLDRSMLATDSQVGAVQVVDAGGRIIAQSAGSPNKPLISRSIPAGAVEYLGHVEFSPQDDYWVSGVGADTPSGPVTILVGADREPVENVIATVAGLLAVAGPIVIALVAVGTHRLVGAALRPVEQIRARVASITSGKLAERIPVPQADDEIARLAQTMNDMLGRLEAGQAAQRRFVSDASHELRSPLATITAALELAHSRPELLQRSLLDEALLPEAQRMHRLVEDLLLLARADEQTDGFKAVDVDIDDIVYAELARVRTFTVLEVSSAISPVRITGDPRALTRLVRNLADNAIRHADNAIRFECSASSGHAQIVVEDDGPGIPASERRRVFDRFVRLDSPRAREAGGAGLGLSIVAQIADAHHGSVVIEESSSGGGRFVARIPLAVDEPVADTAHGLDTVGRER